MNGVRDSLEYCVLRVMPSIERGEFMNVGVVLICRASKFLDCRIALDETRLRALWPSVSADVLDLIQQHLALIPLICAGDPAGGPIANLAMSERWHWLTSPSSTIVQPGPVHTGLGANARTELERLFVRFVGDAAAG